MNDGFRQRGNVSGSSLMGVHGDGGEPRFQVVWLDPGGGAVVEGGTGGCGG